MNMTIQISPKGDIKVLYKDSLSAFRNIGEITISRATNIEFNNITKMWEIIENGKVIGNQHLLREDAINEEIEILENRMYI